MGNLTAKTSGEIASFMTPAKTNIKSLKVYFSPKQLGAGDPSPENVREIEGWDGVEVNGCGKNIAHIFGYGAQNISNTDVTKYKTTNNYGTKINTTIFNNPDTPLIIEQSQAPNTTTPSSYQNGYIAVGTDNLIFGKSYNVSFKVSNITNNLLDIEYPKYIRLLVSNGDAYSVDDVIGNTLIFKDIKFDQNTNTPKRQGFEIRICGMSFTLSEFMVTPVDDEDFEYKPYQGTIDTTNWSSNVGTVYGGYVDLISGELVETHNIITFDGSDDELITHSSNFNDWVQLSGIPNMKKGSFFSDNSSVSNRAKKVSSSSNKNELQILIGADNSKVYIYNVARLDSTVTTDETLRNWFLNNPITFIYPLETPITHQLTPTQLSSFIGQNNFWSNADYVEIEYELKETEDIQKARKKIILNQPQLKSISDKIVSFNTDMVAPIKNCKIYFNPIQLGTGDPSPTNIRNINGWIGIDSYVNGDKVSVDWTNDIGTVYGGYVDLVKGELVAEWEIAQGRWGDIKSSAAVSSTGYYTGKLNYSNTIKISHYQSSYYKNSICNITNTILWQTGEKTPEHFYCGNNSNTNKGEAYIFGNYDDDVTIQIIVKLAEPIHYSLTPQQLLTFKGENNIWSDTNGQTEVKFWIH